MINKTSTILLIILITGCASIKNKIPERKACTGENKTLTDVICKK